jgi:uncharacterized protein (TIGR03437 family)
MGTLAFGQRGGALVSLKQVPVPQPTNLSTYVKDQAALVVLGKALFWDAQTGSDGKTACASCHFHAGADHRLQNILGPPASGAGTVVANQTVTAASFPFHQLANVASNSSAVVKDTRQVSGSAGVFRRKFFGLDAGKATESGTDVAGGTFSVGGLDVRQVGNRNSPSVINAVFNVRNFWDGRAARLFTGQTPFGASDTALNAVALRNGQLVREAIAINNASLASQAVGPPLNTAEMAYDGRQMEANFSIFWGLAIQAYEATLVSDNARLDQFLEGNRQALSALEQQGMQVFQNNRSQSTQCHQGAEFTAASYTNAANTAATNPDPDDIGFFRTGVSPLADDPGLGSVDSFGLPLFAPSRTRANGTFKSPGLRNVEFTGPYFHDGGQATLEQVLQFYARNGDFPARGNLGPGIGQIGLSPADQTAVVAFLKALSDDRVRYEQAPFDHPSLCISAGATEVSAGVLAADTSDPRFTSSAAERLALIPAVGKGGNKAPLQTFEELLAGVGSDGSRAHTLVESCGQPAVTLTARIDAVANAATFAGGAVSPGEIVTVFGANLTGGVTFDGTPATLLYASPAQVSVTVPYSVGGSATTMRMGSASLQLAVVAASPGIFAAVSSGPGTLTLYATGGGSLSKDSLPILTLANSVTVNGEPAQVLYAGVAPGLVEGANQINILLPSDARAGALSIVWTVGGFSSKGFAFNQ